MITTANKPAKAGTPYPTEAASRRTAQRAIPTHGPGKEKILTAYFEARKTQDEMCVKALICGQLIFEQNANVSPFCHDGKMGTFLPKKEEEKFTVWLVENVPQIPQRTAYRWMELAERVMAAVDAPIKLEGGSQNAEISISDALTLPVDQLSAEALSWRDIILGFVRGKTIAAVIDGEMEPHDITRAHNGKSKGGAGGDRKDFVRFTAVKLKHLSTFFAHDLSAGQQAKIVTAFDAALERWPRWVLEPLVEKARQELKLAEEERASRL